MISCVSRLNKAIYLIIIMLMIISNSKAESLQCEIVFLDGSWAEKEIQVEGGTYCFTIPQSLTKENTIKRLFAEDVSWLWPDAQHNNLWPIDIRRERYKRVFIDLACMAQTSPIASNGSRDLLREYVLNMVSKAPLFKDTLLYPVIMQWIESNANLQMTAEELAAELPGLGIGSLSEIIDFFDQFCQTELAANPPDWESLHIFQDSGFAVYDSLSATEKVDQLLKLHNQLKTLGDVFKAINTAKDIIDGFNAVDDAMRKAFLMTSLSGQVAVERLQLVKQTLQTSSIWNDISLQDAIEDANDFLVASSSYQVIDTIIQELSDDVVKLGLPLCKTFFATQIIDKINAVAQLLNYHALTPLQASGWMMGVGFLIQEVLIIMDISEQEERAELAVLRATLGHDLCRASREIGEAEVLSLYCYYTSAIDMVEVFNRWQYWLISSWTKEMWEDEVDYIKGELQYAIDNPCDTEAPWIIVLNPKEQQIVSNEVQIEYDAHDDISLDRVEFWIAGDLKFTDSSGTNVYNWDTKEYSGSVSILLRAFDVAGNTASDNVVVTVNNSLTLTHNGPWNAPVGGSFDINGSLKDVSNNGVEGVTVYAKINGTTRGQGITNSSGNYTINSAQAPINSGTYPVYLEATVGGNLTREESELEVFSDAKGYDPSIQTVKIESYNVKPGDPVKFAINVKNEGENTESFTVESKLYKPDGTLSDSDSDPVTLTKDQSTILNKSLDTTTTPGNYRLIVSLNVTKDEDMSDNSYSAFVFCGSALTVPLLKVDDAYWMDDDLGTRINHSAGTYGITCKVVGTYSKWFEADIYKSGSIINSNVRFNEGDIKSFDGGKYVVYAYGINNSAGSIFVNVEHGVQITSSPISFDPAEPHGKPGGQIIWNMTGPTRPSAPSSGDVMENATVKSWYGGQNSSGNTWSIYFNVPSTVTPGNYDFYMSSYLDGTYYWRKSRFVIDPGHDISVSSILPTNGQHINYSATVPISATVNASNYTEQPNVSLSITNSSGYSYQDSETWTISGSQTKTFSPNWDTTGLTPGDYTLTVTAAIGDDINSGNNSKSVIVTLDSPPTLIVNGGVEASNSKQGTTVLIWASVTGNSSAINDADVVAQINWPDSLQTNYVMYYDTEDSRYECTFVASQIGTYTGTVSASHSGYNSGSKTLPNIVITNAAPDTTITSQFPSEGEWIRQKAINLSWIGSDTGTSISNLQYSWQLDGGSWTTWSSDKITLLENLQEGQHTFNIKSYDGSLEDSEPATRSFNVDSNSPVVVITTNSGNYFLTEESSIILEGTSVDTGPSSGLSEVFINSGVSNEGTLENWRFTVELNEGANILNVYAFDSSGNVGSDTIVITRPEQVSTPTFSPTETTFPDSVNVSIICSTSDVTIRYTLDGTTPSSTAGMIYNDMPINLMETTTIKAIAYKEGMNDSDIAITQYRILGPWRLETPMNIARDQFAGGVIDDNIIVFGGNGNPDGINLKSTEVLSIPEGTWTYLASNEHNFGQGVEELTSVVFQGKLYVFGAWGGYGPNEHYGDINFNECYDPSTGTWQSLAPKPTLVTAAPAVVYDGEIFLFGGDYCYEDEQGTDYQTFYDVVEAYNPTTNTWRTVTQMPSMIKGHAASVIGTKAYIIGGYLSDTLTALADVISYDFETEQWKTEGYTPLPNPRGFPYSSAAPVVNGKIYLIGGVDSDGTNHWAVDNVDIYDPVNNIWEEGPSLPEPRDNHLAVSYNDRIYVIGGNNVDDDSYRAISDVISLNVSDISHEGIISIDVDSAVAGVQSKNSIYGLESIIVQIWAEDVNDLSGFDAIVLFDPNVLECHSADEGAFLSSEGGATTFIPDIDNSIGEVSITGVVLGASEETVPDGSGVIAELTFNILSQEDTDLTIINQTFFVETSDGVEAYVPQDKSAQLFSLIGDFCGPNFGPPDGYVDVWDLICFAEHWHTTPEDPNWDPKYDLAGVSFGAPDGYIDIWDLMLFAQHWKEGTPS